MREATNKQKPSGKEGGEVKAGDFVWVQCKVIEPCESLIKVTGSGDDNWFWAGRGQCRPVEPANSSEIPNSSSDPINPSHYKEGGIECIEAMKVALGGGFLGYLRGNAIKYLWRYDKKNGVEDLKKARWYLDRLIQEVGE
jgi:hypothetical protein